MQYMYEYRAWQKGNLFCDFLTISDDMEGMKCNNKKLYMMMKSRGNVMCENGIMMWLNRFEMLWDGGGENECQNS